MAYFKIYNKPRQAWWRQDCMGYTGEQDAGFFAEDSVAVADAKDRWHEDVLVSFTPSPLLLELRKLTAGQGAE